MQHVVVLLVITAGRWVNIPSRAILGHFTVVLGWGWEILTSPDFGGDLNRKFRVSPDKFQVF